MMVNFTCCLTYGLFFTFYQKTPKPPPEIFSPMPKDMNPIKLLSREGNPSPEKFNVLTYSRNLYINFSASGLVVYGKIFNQMADSGVTCRTAAL